MAINIKNLEERIQKKVHLVDSNTSVDDLTDMVEAALLLTGSLKTYADSSELPTATSSNEKIGFIQDIKAIKFNNGKEWVGMASGEAQAPAGGGGGGGFSLQGSNFGYALGTGIGPSYYHTLNLPQLDAYPYASDAGGTDVGDLAQATTNNSGGASSTHGYRHGGETFPAQSTSVHLNTSEKFTFASNTQIGLLPNMTLTVTTMKGQREAVTNGAHNYILGGYAPAPHADTTIQKGATATDVAFTDVGDLIQVGANVGGHASTTHAYAATAENSQSNIIQKVAFASDGNTTDVGDAGGGQGGGAHNSSSTHGYMYGGYLPSPPYSSNAIHKFAFASDGNSTSVTTLPATRSERGGGNQSTTNGYFHNASAYKTIYRFPFAAEDTITNVGDISDTNGARYNGSTQY